MAQRSVEAPVPTVGASVQVHSAMFGSGLRMTDAPFTHPLPDRPQTRRLLKNKLKIIKKKKKFLFIQYNIFQKFKFKRKYG
jgi:hypothetical protein